MGMIVTILLISANVYNSIYAPPGRGFSYIELWFTGIQIPILVSLLEYSVLLGLNKFYNESENNSKIFVNSNVENEIFKGSQERKLPLKPIKPLRKVYCNDLFIKKVDKITFLVSVFYFLLFTIGYWTFLY